jgi:hypothetical protein
MHKIKAIAILVGCLLVASASAAEETIATIDTYGLGNVGRDAVLEAAAIRVGDRVPTAEAIDEMVRKLKAIPGVEQADVSVIHMRSPHAPAASPTFTIVYIGIGEAGRPAVTFRAAPSADVALPDEIVETYREFEIAADESFRRGNFGGDDSNGYALFGDEATRAIQKRFVPLAERHYDRLAEVLRTAKSAKGRQTAAWIIGYAPDKTKAAAELDAAARDPDSVVRNNAIRALAVILGYAAKHPELAIDAPIDVYLDLLESVEWTDRNKAMAVLIELSGGGNEAVLAKLRQRSLPALVEMARWQAEGHAGMAFGLVGRIAGLSDTEIEEAWTAGKREEVIARALRTENGK